MKTLWPVVVPVLCLTVVCAVVAAFVSGSHAALGAALGGLLVTAFLSATPAILGPATKANPQASMLIALAVFGGKVTILMVLLAVFVSVDAVTDHIDSTALGVTLLITSVASTTLQILAYTRTRIPAYDLGNSD